MNVRANGFARQMQGFREFWRKKRHRSKGLSNQSVSRETEAWLGFTTVSWQTNDVLMTAVHNRIGSAIQLQALMRLEELVS